MTTREGATDEDKDFIEHLFTASTHDYLMFFTNTGRVYVERVHEIPDMGRAAKGRSIANLLELKAGEKIAALIRVLVQDRREQGRHDLGAVRLNFSSPRKQGTVKKTSLKDFANVRKGGIIAIGIDPGDTLIDVKLTQPAQRRRRAHHPRRHEHPLQRIGRALDGPARRRRARHQSGKGRRSRRAGRRRAGRDAAGRRRKRHRQAHGLRRIPPVQSRGGKGIITMKTTEKTGGVVGALTVRDNDEIMLITVGGQMVRIPVKGIREAGRNTQGVKLVNLDAGDKLQAIAPVIGEDKEDAASEAEPEK